MGTEITSQGSFSTPLIYKNDSEPAIDNVETPVVETSESQGVMGSQAVEAGSYVAAPSDSYDVATNTKNQLVKPENDKGITAAFGTTSAGEVQVTGHVSLAPAALQQLGSQMGKLLDLDKNMSLGAYTNAVSKLSSRNGYYKEAQTKANESMVKIEQNMAFLKAQTPVDEVQLNQLEQLKEVAGTISTLYGHLMEAKAKKEPELSDQVSAFIEDVAKLQNCMIGLDPMLIGEQAYMTMRESLTDMGELAYAYVTCYSETVPNKEAFGVFVLKTFRRLQQIQNGQRKRDGEVPTITGAIKTYANDLKDKQAFMCRFASIREQVVASGNMDPDKIFAKVQETTKGTSPRFQETLGFLAQSYANLAEAEVFHGEAKAHYQEAQEALKNGERELQKAEERLVNAGIALNNGYSTMAIPKNTTNVNTLEVATKVKDAALLLNKKAGVHIENYFVYHKEGERAANKAHLEAEVAGECLNVAGEWNDLVKESSYGRYMQAETTRVDGKINASKADLVAIEHGLGEIKQKFTVLDRYAYEMLADMDNRKEEILAFDVNISTNALLEKSVELGSKGIDAAYGRIMDVIQASGVPISHNLRQFLKDSAAFLEKNPAEAGNVREELVTLFKEYPELTTKVAGAVADLRTDFGVARMQLEDKIRKAGGNPRSGKYALMLDSMESTMLDGLMAKNPYLFNALLESGNYNGQVRTTIKWMQDLQLSMGQHVVADAELRQKAVANFEANLANNPTYKENIEARIAEYGKPIATECFSLSSNNGLNSGTINVYVFQKDGKYFALDPVTNDLYSSKTKDGALAELADGVTWAEGKLSYMDSQGELKTAAVHMPDDTFVLDIGMGVLGLAGGVMMLVPLPVAPQIAGLTCMSVSSVYFLGKGAMNVTEQVSHHNFDLSRPESREALVDLVSGVLGMVGGAGSAVNIVNKTSGIAMRTTATLANTTSRLARVTRVAAAASKISNASGVAGAGYSVVESGMQIVDVLNDNSLSEQEKNDKICEIVGNLGVNTVSAAVGLF